MSSLLSFIEGGVANKSVIVFLAGFPDNETSAWGNISQNKLGEDHRLIFLCLPEFQLGNHKFVRWGYTFDEILNKMYATLYSLNVIQSGKFDLIVHDWGAIIGLKYQNKYPEQVRKMVMLDVAMLEPHHTELKYKLRILCYQIWWAMCYFISQAISFQFGQLLFYISICRPIVWLGPMPIEPLEIPSNEMTVAKCYPYYYLWRDKMSGSWIEPKYPTCSLYYMVCMLFVTYCV